MLLARYLVEENNENYVEFNIESTCENKIILSIFKALIGHYQIFDQQTENNCIERIQLV